MKNVVKNIALYVIGVVAAFLPLTADAATVERHKIRVTGVIKFVSVKREDEKIVSNNLAFDLFVENTSNSPVVLFPGQIQVTGAVICMPGGKQVGNLSNVGSSFLKTRAQMIATWGTVSPNSPQPITLRPGERLKVESWLMLDSYQLIDDPTKTLEYLRTLGPLTLIVKTGFIDPSYQIKGRVRASRALWPLLRRPWSAQGYLWLENVDSEPISFSLANAVIQGA